MSAVSKPAGGPGMPSGVSASSKKSRGEMSYGSSSAGFSPSGGMDGLAASKKQVNPGKAKAPKV